MYKITIASILLFSGILTSLLFLISVTGLLNNSTSSQVGNDVFVTYVDGLAKGTKMRVTMKSKNTAMTGMGKLTRVK